MKPVRLNRELHRWGSILVAIPILLLIGSGIFLVLKKNIDWIQPPTQSGMSQSPTITFDSVLQIAKSVPETSVQSWDDVDRLDVRPGRGLIKVRAKNRWEIQIDSETGVVLQVAYRRSDIIESLHDGSYLFSGYGLWVLLPVATTLLLLWVTGMYMFIRPYLRKP
jgi:uncharacterized iron-regulated membrane protein